ncbi:hypothetical protein QUF63_04165 [Anaerolineales bacterium HSG25]|nr:hypothetical protein [Anaerolineales bacterium HSG25]
MAINPGESLTLTSDSSDSSGAIKPFSDYTEWTGSFVDGTTKLYVYLDSLSKSGTNGKILESDENDNLIELDLSLPPAPTDTPGPTATPTHTATSTPTSTPLPVPATNTPTPTPIPTTIPTLNGPNLVASFTLNPPNPRANQKVVITVKVTNIGNENSYSGYVGRVIFYPGPKKEPQVGTQNNQTLTWWPKVGEQGLVWDLQTLDPNESVTLSSNFVKSNSGWSGKFFSMTEDLYLIVDPFNVLDETNENDNKTYQHLTSTGVFPEPEVDLNGFRPQPNGLSYANYGLRYKKGDTLHSNYVKDSILVGRHSPYPKEAEVDKQMMIEFFGTNSVCRGYGCKNLTASAAAFAKNNAENGKGGHCYGFATFSQALFHGMVAPGDIQAGATTAYDLEYTNPEVLRNIKHHHISQSLDPVDGDNGWVVRGRDKTTWTDQYGNITKVEWEKNKPSEVLNLIRKSFEGGETPYVLAFYKRGGGGGHAVTPYGITDRGNGIYWLHVYDNNFPAGTRRYLEFDTIDETWLYTGGGTNPDTLGTDYEGDETTDTLGLRNLYVKSGWGIPEERRNSAPRQGAYVCPFCSPAGIGASQTDSPMVQFQLFGEGGMLVVAPDGKRVGYDWETLQEVNEIGGSETIPILDGLGKETSPLYKVPLATQGDNPYTVIISSKVLTDVSANLNMTGPGFVVGFDHISLDILEVMTMTIAPDGRTLTFEASADAKTPAITFGLDPEDITSDSPSYLLDIDGMEIEEGKLVTVTFDIDNGKVIISDNDDSPDNYDIDLTRINGDGTTDVYQHEDVSLNGGDSAQVNVGDWDGASDPMPILIDDEGDGFEDETPVMYDNQRPLDSIYLPIIVR